MFSFNPFIVVVPAETLRVVVLEKSESVGKSESVEYCTKYPEAFATLPTVTATESEPVVLTLKDGAAKDTYDAPIRLIVWEPFALVAVIGKATALLDLYVYVVAYDELSAASVFPLASFKFQVE